MLLDLKTLMASNMMLVFFISLVLLFYRKNYKTYSGFGFWLASTMILSAAFLSYFFRQTSLEVLAILFSNCAGVLVFVLRFDGIVRFIYDRGISMKTYLLPVLTAPFLLYFYLVKNDMALRGLGVSTVIAMICAWVALEFFRNMIVEHKNLFLFSGFLYLIYSVMISGRSILWLLDERYDFSMHDMLHEPFFLLTTIFEVGFGISFLMLNNKRTETELSNAKNELQTSIEKLETAISEVKSLKGMIPICMHCKEIRDDRGYWSRLEEYLSDHTEAEFSHSICDKCLEKYHPE